MVDASVGRVAAVRRTTWVWHVPAAYEFALRSPGWHYVEHVCFLGTGLLFWFPVMCAPIRAGRDGRCGCCFRILFLADVQNTVLSALLTFSTESLYPYYAECRGSAGVGRRRSIGGRR